MRNKNPTQTRDSLTPREVEVLSRVAAGQSDKVIADELGISYNTVKWYIRQIFNKLGVNDRTQAAVWATRHGIVLQ